MKKLLLAITCVIASLCQAAEPAATPAPVETVDGQQWQLVWNDEFDKPGAPDPAKWDYEEGFVRNKEPQYYTRDRRENARVEDGNLVIESRKEEFPNPFVGKPKGTGIAPATQPDMAHYTSASLITLGKAEFQYGRFIMRAKLPGFHGTWPAFWMLGVNRAEVHWPACGEIDILEHFSNRPTKVRGSMLFINKNNKFQSVSKEITPQVSVWDDYHTYEARWSADHIDIYFDGIKYSSMNVDDAAPGDKNAFRKPMYLLLNLAMGSSTGKIDDAKMPAKYLIDYVRVYKPAGEVK